MKALSASCAAALAAVSFVAAAQTQAPGLWEHSMTFKTQSGEMEKAMAEMQKQLAAMPPEQRKQMEQMMAGRGMSTGPKGTSYKVCLTKEEAARQAAPKMADANCNQEVVQRSAQGMKVKWTCGGQNPSSGEGEITFKSDKAYSGKADVTSTVKGKPETTHIEQSGQWLSADCGDIKPRAPAGKP